MSIGLITILIAVAFALSFLTESLVEYFFGTPFDKFAKLTPWKWTLSYIAALVGVGLAVFWKLDLIAIIANGIAQLGNVDFAWDVSIVGQVLSGLAIGRGSNFLHDFLAKALQKPSIPLETKEAAIGFQGSDTEDGEWGAVAKKGKP